MDLEGLDSTELVVNNAGTCSVLSTSLLTLLISWIKSQHRQ